MLRSTRRYLGSPALPAVGLIVLLWSSLAEAQLFPNRTLNRQRTPCAAESPFNAQVRRDYFGYYPTCWTRFPAGWSCPGYNPEAPNLAASLAEIPLIKNRNPSADDSGYLGPEENPEGPMEGPPAAPGTEPNVPLPNPGRSPFELDPNPKPTAPKPTEPDPFNAPVPTNPKPGNPGPPSGGRAVPPTGLLEMPTIPATTPSARVESTLEPGSMVMIPEPEATLASNANGSAGSSRPDLGPLPSMPAPPANYPTNVVVEDSQPIPTTTAPAQAPGVGVSLAACSGRGTPRTVKLHFV